MEKCSSGKNIKSDVPIAKNYLTLDEIDVSKSNCLRCIWTMQKTKPNVKFQ